MRSESEIVGDLPAEPRKESGSGDGASASLGPRTCPHRPSQKQPSVSHALSRCRHQRRHPMVSRSLVRRPPVIRLLRPRRPETTRWTTAGAPVLATPRARGDRWASWLFRDRHFGAPARQRTPHSARRIVPARRDPLARPAIGSPAASHARACTIPCRTESAHQTPGVARESRARADRPWVRRPAMRRRRARHERERLRRMSARSPDPATRATRAWTYCGADRAAAEPRCVSWDARSTRRHVAAAALCGDAASSDTARLERRR